MPESSTRDERNVAATFDVKVSPACRLRGTCLRSLAALKRFKSKRSSLADSAWAADMALQWHLKVHQHHMVMPGSAVQVMIC